MSVLYVHDHSGGHRSSPNLPCRPLVWSSVIAQVAGTPSRQVIGHRGVGAKAVFQRLSVFCEIFRPLPRSAVN